MEHAAHDVVVVPGEDGDAVSALPVPDADGLQGGHNSMGWRNHSNRLRKGSKSTDCFLCQ